MEDLPYTLEAQESSLACIDQDRLELLLLMLSVFVTDHPEHTKSAEWWASRLNNALEVKQTLPF